MVPYRCTIDILTHMALYGVPMGPPRPRLDLTAAQRTTGGTVGPHFIGAPQCGRSAAPIGTSLGFWYSLPVHTAASFHLYEMQRKHSLTEDLASCYAKMEAITSKMVRQATRVASKFASCPEMACKMRCKCTQRRCSHFPKQ